MGEMRNEYKILIGITEETRPFEKPKIKDGKY
jgi:hypothetical protein